MDQEIRVARAAALLRIESLDQRRDVLLVDRVEDFGLAGEVVVQRRLAEPHFVREHLHGRAVVAARVEQIRAALDDLLALVVMRRRAGRAALFLRRLARHRSGHLSVSHTVPFQLLGDFRTDVRRKLSTLRLKASLRSPATMWPAPATLATSSCGNFLRN